MMTARALCLTAAFLFCIGTAASAAPITGTNCDAATAPERLFDCLAAASRTPGAVGHAVGDLLRDAEVTCQHATGTVTKRCVGRVVQKAYQDTIKSPRYAAPAPVARPATPNPCDPMVVWQALLDGAANSGKPTPPPDVLGEAMMRVLEMYGCIARRP